MGFIDYLKNSINESKGIKISLGGEIYIFTLKEESNKAKKYNVVKDGETVETVITLRKKEYIIADFITDLDKRKQFMTKDNYESIKSSYEALPNGAFGRIHGSEFHSGLDLEKKFGKKDTDNLYKKLG